jgi:uncharacterized protein YbjT (DUF2867 family)
MAQAVQRVRCACRNDAAMRVLVTGAYGLIGSACLARLHAAGHDLVAAGHAARSHRRFPYAHWVTVDFARLTKPELWRPHLAGIDAVVNCVGVLRDGAGDNVQRVQFDGTVALFEACMQVGVKRFIHISAIGAAADGPSVFSRSKAAAEARLKTLAVNWVIVRPGLVLAPAAYGGGALLRGLAAFPLCSPLVGAGSAIQTVDINDVADTVTLAIAPHAPLQVVWDVAHPKVHMLADIVRAMRGWLGFPARPVLRVPRTVATVAAWLGDAIGRLGWRSPVSITALAQLEAGVVGDPQSWMAATGIKPRSLEDSLAAHPAGVQDRWFARLYLLKPVALFALAAITTAAGFEELITFWKVRVGLFDVPFAILAVTVLPTLVHSVVAPVIGAGILVRATSRLSLIALLLLTIADIVDHALRPWLHMMIGPLHALAMQTPMLLAILFALAILDDR